MRTCSRAGSDLACESRLVWGAHILSECVHKGKNEVLLNFPFLAWCQTHLTCVFLIQTSLLWPPEDFSLEFWLFNLNLYYILICFHFGPPPWFTALCVISGSPTSRCQCATWKNVGGVDLKPVSTTGTRPGCGTWAGPSRTRKNLVWQALVSSRKMI